MKEKKIDSDLQRRVRKYLEFKIRNESSHYFQAEEILKQNLTGKLKDEFLQQSYDRVINAFPIIKSNFTSKMQNKLVHCIKSVNLRPGDVLLKVKIYNFSFKKTKFEFYFI